VHRRQGQRQRAVAVNGNWRITFEFRDGNAYSLEYEDYH
jgi:proteic killer suppression protein